MPKNKKNTRLAINLLMIVVGMVMMAYASVPLYKLFCQKTGFGGTPMVAKQLPSTTINRVVNIRFDTNVDSTLGWEFKADQGSTSVKVGENGIGLFSVQNKSGKDKYGMAAYNVTPEKAAKYFNKVVCFCFEKQLVKAGQEVQFPVSYFVDPEFAGDPYMDDVDTITLSYTFYRYKAAK